jgi:hypothetical protein
MQNAVFVWMTTTWMFWGMAESPAALNRTIRKAERTGYRYCILPMPPYEEMLTSLDTRGVIQLLP